MTEVPVALDDNVLEEIAGLICGDDGAPWYRRGFEIEKFFRAAGWDVDECEGGRKNWTLEQLQDRSDDPDALRAVLLRLADPREYIGAREAHSEVVHALNELLALEGYQVVHDSGRPSVVERELLPQRPLTRAPLELRASLAEVVSDRVFGEQLRKRLDEASTCWSAGASVAAIVMLGSVLEGVLYDVAVARGARKPEDNLGKLLDLAKREEWIAKDAFDFADVLRQHRNIVHPKKQRDEALDPDEDTVLMAWNVVVTALNDLGPTSSAV